MKHISAYALPLASSNFETRKIKQADDHTLHIQPTMLSLTLRVLVVSVGFGLLAFWCFNFVSSENNSSSVYLPAIGVLITSTGIYSYYTGNERNIINREVGAVFVSAWAQIVPNKIESISNNVLPTDIVAVRIVSKALRTSESRRKQRAWTTHYTEYQINLCTADTNRVNVFVTLQSNNAIKAGYLISEILNAELVNNINADQPLFDQIFTTA